MTDRLAQIQARLDRREKMVEDGTFKIARTFCADPEMHGFSEHPKNVQTESVFHGSYISHLQALADHVPYLLAMVRERDAALERVRELAHAWESRGEHDMRFSKTIPDEDIAMAILTNGAQMVENARHIRAAITATEGA